MGKLAVRTFEENRDSSGFANIVVGLNTHAIELTPDPYALRGLETRKRDSRIYKN